VGRAGEGIKWGGEGEGRERERRGGERGRREAEGRPPMLETR